MTNNTFERYKTALNNAQTIIRDYSSTAPAMRLMQGELLGTYTVKELQDSIVPKIQKNAEMEGDPLALARFLLNKINGDKDLAALEVARHYAKAGRYDEAMELIGTISNASRKEEALYRLVEAHAEAGHFEQAKQIAESIQAPDLKCSAACVLAESLRLPDQAKEILDQVRQVTDSIANAYEKSNLQSQLGDGYFTVAATYIELGKYQQAEDIATTISWSKRAPYILALIADKYAESQQFDKARAFAEGIQDSAGKASALASIGKRYAEAGRFDDAMRIVERLQEFWNKDEVLTAIAAKHAQSGHFDQAVQVANSIHIQSLEKKREAFIKIITESTKAAQLAKAMQIAQDIQDPYSKSEALAIIAESYAKAGQLDPALLHIASTIEDASRKSFALGSIADKFAEARHFDLALQFARTIEDSSMKATVLAQISGKYFEAGQFEEAAQILDEVKQIETTIENPYFKSARLEAIADRYEKAGQTDKAIEVLSQAIQTIKTVKAGRDYSAPRDSAENRLLLTASGYGSTGQFTLALHVIKSLENVSDQATTLAEIGIKYPQLGQKPNDAARKILYDIIAANQ